MVILIQKYCLEWVYWVIEKEYNWCLKEKRVIGVEKEIIIDE
jgi:hypothetical protein